jgi:low affinity Fe/Cu permease
MNMDTEDYIDMLSVRAADMRAMALFFAIIHTGLLVVLGFAGSGLEDSGIQLALTAVVVLTSLWTVFFMDDCMQDLFAISRDLPEDFQASNVGKRFSGVSLPLFRVVNFLVIGLIVLAEVLAIY